VINTVDNRTKTRPKKTDEVHTEEREFGSQMIGDDTDEEEDEEDNVDKVSLKRVSMNSMNES
jgi:hypothetical protein